MVAKRWVTCWCWSLITKKGPSRLEEKTEAKHAAQQWRCVALNSKYERRIYNNCYVPVRQMSFLFKDKRLKYSQSNKEKHWRRKKNTQMIHFAHWFELPLRCFEIYIYCSKKSLIKWCYFVKMIANSCFVLSNI